MSQDYPITISAAPISCTGRLLDAIPVDGDPLGVAFSVRKVASRYRGACMRVRRAVDNAELDVGFVQTRLDIEELLEFCAGFDGFVSVWYDQTGQGRHATQADPALQPRVVRGGEYIGALEFNGTFLKTTWEPANLESGAGVLAVAAVQATQAGNVEDVPQPGLTNDPVTTDYPNDLLPEGQDTFLFEGLQTGANDSRVLYMENGAIAELNVDIAARSVTKAVTGQIVPNGPPMLTVDTLDTGGTGPVPTNQWRRGLKLFNSATTPRLGRIYGIPYGASQILEIDYVNKQVARIDLPPEVPGATAAKFWMAVASADGTKGYCIPSSARYVVEIDCTTVTPTASATVSVIGPELDATPTNKWHDAVLGRNGRVYAVPHNENRVLEIDPVARTVAFLDLPAGVPQNAQLFSAAAAWQSSTTADGKVFGIPWAAATILVIDVSTPVATASFHFSTGMSVHIQSRGTGYAYAPTLTVDPPGPQLAGDPARGDQMTVQATIGYTSTITSLPVTNEGSGYVSSAGVSVRLFNVRREDAVTVPTVSFLTPLGATPTMALVDPSNPQLGYKITGVTFSNTGVNLMDDNFSRSPVFTVSGGKGRTATALAILDASPEGRLTGIGFNNYGSGYTSFPTIWIAPPETPGGVRATAVVTALDPIEYTAAGSFLLSTGGGIAGVRVVNPGSGYTRVPAVVVLGGKGVTAAFGLPVLAQDGKVTQVSVTDPGTGYSEESDADAANAATRFVTLGSPASTGGNPGGVHATAKVTAVGPNGEITAVQMVNCGSGYLSAPSVTFRALPGQQAAMGSATWDATGRIENIPVTGVGTKYAAPPLIAGFDDRQSRDGGAGITPGPQGIALVRMEGVSPGDPRTSATYPNGSIPLSEEWIRGNRKFIAAYVNDTDSVFSLPYTTHRVLQINALTNKPTDVIPNGSGFLQKLYLDGQYVSGVASLDNKKFYGIPYQNKRVLKITGSTGAAEYLPQTFDGRWNFGVCAWNRNIYCVPAESSSLLVIDTKEESKSEVLPFTNLRGSVLNKWWGAVLAGEPDATAGPAQGLIFGIPSDLSVLLELNPGVPLRSKTLPSSGCVMPDKRLVVYTPSTSGALLPGGKAVNVYDSVTKQLTAHQISATGNVSYAEGIPLSSSEVLFVPCYNLEDAFVYEGRIGHFDTASNTFTYLSMVNVELAAPYPSRGGVQYAAGKVAWVPRDGTAAVTLYDVATNTVTPSTAQREQTKASFASSVATASGNVVVFQPTLTSASNLAAPAYPRDNYYVDRFGGAVLTRDDKVVLVPGTDSAYEHVTIFWPANPGAPLDVTPSADGGVNPEFVTRIDLPEALAADFTRLGLERNGNKFSGAVLGSDNKVYCCPFQRHSVLVVDHENYQVEEVGDYAAEWDAVGGSLWRGAVAGPDKVVYFVPFNARRFLAVNPSVANPLRKSYLVGPDLSSFGNGKWWGGALGSDGRVYCSPHNASVVLVFDPRTATVETIALPGVVASVPGKFSSITTGPDGLLYMVPWNARYIVAVDSVNAQIARWTSLRVDTGDTYYSDALVGTNGKLYFLPIESFSSVLEFDVFTDDFEWYSVVAGWYTCGVAARNGRMYGFPGRYADTVLEIVADTRTIGVYRPASLVPARPESFTKVLDVQQTFRLRPFPLTDGSSFLFHTGGGAYAVYSSATSEFYAFVVGSALTNGVAARFAQNTTVNVVGDVMNIISPLRGGIAGVKSGSGTADLYLLANQSDLVAAVGGGTLDVAGLFDRFFANGNVGVYAALAGSGSGTLESVVRDVPLTRVPYTWAGASGDTFAVGRIEGTATATAPAFRSGLNGQVAEVVVFASDQQDRAQTLGESSSFYFLPASAESTT